MRFYVVTLWSPGRKWKGYYTLKANNLDDAIEAVVTNPRNRYAGAYQVQTEMQFLHDRGYHPLKRWIPEKEKVKA